MKRHASPRTCPACHRRTLTTRTDCPHCGATLPEYPPGGRRNAEVFRLRAILAALLPLALARTEQLEANPADRAQAIEARAICDRAIRALDIQHSKPRHK